MNAKSATIRMTRLCIPARRVNQALTARMEKRALQWMAERAPRWVTSDQLTCSAWARKLERASAMRLSRYDRRALLLVILCLALNWLGDSMDGTLARVRRQQRPRYGFYVDHMVDIFGSVALMCGLGCSGFLHWQTAIAMLVAFLLLSSESYLATYTLSCFELSQGIFGPTEIRILLIIGNLALLRSPYSKSVRAQDAALRPGRNDCGGGMFAMAIFVDRAPYGATLPPGAVAVNTFIRWGKFNLVGAMGMVVQLAALALFNRCWRGPLSLASAAAIELTLLHNFVWHLHYTWRDRRDAPRCSLNLLRFHLSNGLVSMLGNLALMRILVHEARMPVLAANAIAILCCSIVNFLSRILSCAVIPLGAALPRTLISDLPGGFGNCSSRLTRIGPMRSAAWLLAARFPPYLVLLRVGFTLPPALPPERCALTAPFHPYPGAGVSATASTRAGPTRVLRFQGGPRPA
jgi:archaetidylinositol phosphate synthase